MAKRILGSTVFIFVALAVGSKNTDAGYCLDSPDRTALQIVSYNNVGDCIAHERSGGLPIAPNHQRSAVETRTAPVVAESLPVPLVAPLIPTLLSAEDASSAPSNRSLAYSILEKKDDHVLSGVRVVMRIRLSRKASESELRNIGEEIISQEMVSRRLNAIHLFYYLADADTSDLSIAGTAVWAPGGHWGAAHTVRLGDYSRHQHVVSDGNAERAWEYQTAPGLPGTTR